MISTSPSIEKSGRIGTEGGMYLEIMKAELNFLSLIKSKEDSIVLQSHLKSVTSPSNSMKLERPAC